MRAHAPLLEIEEYQYNLFFIYFRYLEKTKWVISDEEEEAHPQDANLKNHVPTVPALKCEIPYLNECCPVCR